MKDMNQFFWTKSIFYSFYALSISSLSPSFLCALLESHCSSFCSFGLQYPFWMIVSCMNALSTLLPAVLSSSVRAWLLEPLLQ